MLYSFHYVWDQAEDPERTGYMADEVEVLYPHAVLQDSEGFKMVNYSEVPASA